MKLTSIQAIGLKGHTFNHDLQPLTIVTGDNGSGKTAITDAIKIALMGHHPALGKTNPATMELADADRLEIRLGFNSDSPGTFADLHRVWKRTKAGSIKAEHLLADEHGEFLDLVPPVILDFSAFSKAKATDRQRILESAMGEIDADETADAITTRLAELGDRYQEEPVTSYGDLEKQAREVAKERMQEKKRLQGAIQQSVVDDATTALAEEAISEKDLLAAEKDQQELAERNGKLCQVLDDLNRKLMRAPDKPDQPEPTEAEMKKAQNEVDALEQAQKQNAEAAQHNERIHARIRQINGELESLPVEQPKPATFDPSAEQITEAQKQAADLNNEVVSLEHDLQRNQQQATRLKSERDKILQGKCCPMCGTEGDDLKAQLEKHFGSQLSEIGEARRTMLERHEKARQQATEAHERVETMQEQAAMSASTRQWKKRAPLEKVLEELKEELEPCQTIDMRPPIERLRALEQRLHDWLAYRQAEVPSQDDLAKAREEHETNRKALDANIARVAEMKEKRAAITDAQTRVRNQARYQQQLEQAATDEKDIKALADWAKMESLKQTSAALRPILEPANRILEDVVNGQLEIIGTDPGLKRGERFLKLEVLSGAEASAVAIGIQAAMASRGPLKTILIDEMSQLTKRRRAHLVMNIRRAIENGMIEQAILTDHDDGFWAAAIEDGDLLINTDQGTGGGA